MIHRDIEYTVVQEISRGTWRWTVDLDDRTNNSGQRNTREAASTTAELIIDRWLTSKQAAKAVFRHDGLKRNGTISLADTDRSLPADGPVTVIAWIT